jgi:hypothetical protein
MPINGLFFGVMTRKISRASARISASWGSIGAILLLVTTFAVSRLVGTTIDDRHPIVVGGLVLTRQGQRLGSTPLFSYVGDVKSRSAVLGVAVTGGGANSTARVLFSDIIEGSCQIIGGAIISGPRPLGIDSAFYSLHQGYQRRVFAVDISVAAHQRLVSISCNVSDIPERETVHDPPHGFFAAYEPRYRCASAGRWLSTCLACNGFDSACYGIYRFHDDRRTAGS